MPEIIIATLVGFAIVFGVCGIMGTLNSGYHFVDDHEYLAWTYNLKHNLSFKELLYWNVRDDGNRFRPLYMFFRTVWIYFFGTNLFIHSVIKAIQSAISLVCLYFVARNHNIYPCSKPLAASFALMCYIGYQTCTWWKLGTTEVQGILTFSIGFLLTETYIRNKQKKYMIMSLVMFELMSLLKENLFILLPFVGFYTLFSDIRMDLTEKTEKIDAKYVWNIIKSRMIFYVFLILIVLETLYACVFLIDPSAYKGGEYFSSESLLNTEAWIHSITHDLKWFVLFGMVFSGILLTYYERYNNMWMDVVLLVIFILPQIMVFSKSGMDERYILPSSVGYSFFFVIAAFGQKVLNGLRKKIYICCLILLLLAHARAALIEADYFRYRGNSVQSVLDFAAQTINNDPDVKICSALRYFESNRTIQYYLKLYAKENIYYYYETDDEIDGYGIDEDYWGLGNSSNKYSLDQMDVIIEYGPEDRHFTQSTRLDHSEFEMKQYGTLLVYVRKGSNISFPDASIKPPAIIF